MNNEIFEFYKEQIKDYEKLTFDEAKNILRNSIDKDDEEKKLIIERVFKGTLHHVLRFIKNSKYSLLESYNYDLNDVISISYSLWYEKIKNYSILEIEDITRAIGITFGNEIVRSLISSNTELDYYNQISNRVFFNKLIEIYFYLRNRKMEVSVKELFDVYIQKYHYNSYFHCSEIKVCYDMAYIMDILEKCYLNFSKNDSEEVVLNKQCIMKMSKLIEEFGLFSSLSDDYLDKTSFEDKVMEQIEKEDINNTIFNTDILNEREKKIIALRFGLLGYKPHDLEHTGQHFGITRERVRQLETKALKKLRIRKNERLREYL